MRPSRLIVLTGLVVVLVLTTSLLGLFAEWPYAAETADWRLQARAQDAGNLVAVVVLAWSALRAARGSFRGRLVWAGALLYLAYAAAIYAFTLHFGPLFCAYVAVLGLSAHGVLLGLPWRDGVRVGPGPQRVAGLVLGGIAGLFGLLWLASIVPATLRGTVPAELVSAGLVANPVHVLDLALVLPGMVVTVALARRGSGPETLLLAPWLVFAALMAASIAGTLVAGGAWLPAVVVGLVAMASAGAGRAVLASVQTTSGRREPPLPSRAPVRIQTLDAGGGPR